MIIIALGPDKNPLIHYDIYYDCVTYSGPKDITQIHIEDEYLNEYTCDGQLTYSAPNNYIDIALANGSIGAIDFENFLFVAAEVNGIN